MQMRRLKEKEFDGLGVNEDRRLHQSKWENKRRERW